MKIPSNKKHSPIIVTGTTKDSLGYAFLHLILSSRTTAELKDDLRERSIPVPKTKGDMIFRLSHYLRANDTPRAIVLY